MHICWLELWRDPSRKSSFEAEFMNGLTETARSLLGSGQVMKGRTWRNMVSRSKHLSTSAFYRTAAANCCFLQQAVRVAMALNAHV